MSYGLGVSFGRLTRLAKERERLRPEAINPETGDLWGGIEEEPILLGGFPIDNMELNPTILKRFFRWLRRKWWYWWHYKFKGVRITGVGVYSRQGIQRVDYD